MDPNRIEGAARELGGRAQDAVGNAIGDSRTQARGVLNQGYGQAQNAAGQLNDTIRDQPLLSAAIAVGIGFILGRLTA
jgi:uncharacterized protein YjbJ (UPF0337 family)